MVKKKKTSLLFNINYAQLYLKTTITILTITKLIHQHKELEKFFFRPRKVTQWVKFLPGKHADPSSSSQTPYSQMQQYFWISGPAIEK